MKRIHRNICAALFLLSVITAQLQAHSPGFFGAFASVPIFYDFKNQTIGSGISVNGVLVVFNGGIEYRHWFASSFEPSKFDIYLGLGFGPLIQYQWSLKSSSVRIRSDLIFLTESTPLFSTKGERGLVISIFAEQFPGSPKKIWMGGIAVGVTIW